VYGWPVDDAVRQAVDTIRAASNEGAATLVLFGTTAFDLARRALGGR
jgi:hypothetical protein